MKRILPQFKLRLIGWIPLLDKGIILFSVIFYFMEFWMHAYAHHTTSSPPINGIYLIFFYVVLRIVFDISILNDIFKTGFFWWLFWAMIFLLSNYLITILGYYHQYYPAINDILNASLTSFALMFSFLVLFSRKSNFHFATQLLPFSILFACLNNLYDLVNLDPDYGFGFDLRGAGNYLNPNVAAQVILMGAVIVIFDLPKAFKSLFFIILTVGIFATLSRGAFPILILILLLLLLQRQFNLVYTSLAVLFIAALLYFAYRTFSQTKTFDRIAEYVEYNKGVGERLAQMTSPNKTKVGIRAKVFKEHFDYYMEHPILGNGLSSSKYIEENISRSGHSSHFMYVHVLNEYGILGLIMLIMLPFSFLFFNGTIRMYKQAFLFLIIFFLAGVQSHNLYDTYSMLFCYGLMGAIRIHQ